MSLYSQDPSFFISRERVALGEVKWGIPIRPTFKTTVVIQSLLYQGTFFIENPPEFMMNFALAASFMAVKSVKHSRK